MYTKPGAFKHWDFELIDLCMLFLSYSVAYWLRHRDMSKFWSPHNAAVLAVIVFASFVASQLFHNHRDILKRGHFVELGKVVVNSLTILIFLITFLFLVKDSGQYSRLLAGIFFVISIGYVYLGRELYKAYLHRRSKTSLNRRKVLLIASHAQGDDRIRKWITDKNFIMDVAGLIFADRTMAEDDSQVSKSFGVPVPCTLADLPDYIRNKWVDEVFVLLSTEERSNKKVASVLSELSIMGITIHTILNVSAANERQTVKTVEVMGNDVILTESLGTVATWQRVCKRLIDIVGACVGLIFTGLFTVVFGPVIYFTDPGPIFYLSDRVGKNGRIFRMYKFRTMYKDADARKAALMAHNEMNGLMFKMKDDPRILGSGPDGTRHGIGWLLRTTSIDEFPQFLNVLKGDMSLVGTRPPTKDEWMQYESRHRARMAVRPGITGLWQASGRSDIKDFDEVIKLDLQYINNFSIHEDMKIIFKTVGVVLLHKGAE